MNKRNLWIVGGIVVILIAAGIYAFTRNSNDNNSNTNASNPNGSTTSSNSSTSSNQSTSSQIIVTKTDPTTGEYLATGSDQPLYTYSSDTTGVSNCTGSCLTEWPIYGPVSTPASLPANVTIISRSDGKAQYAYKGLPLYTFTNDGTTPTGNGIAGFKLATP